MMIVPKPQVNTIKRALAHYCDIVCGEYRKEMKKGKQDHATQCIELHDTLEKKKKRG